MTSKERQKKKSQALSFSQDGLYGLIRTPSPTSSAFKLHTMHSHTHTQRVALCSINATHYPLHTPTHTQTNQAVVDLCTGACGKLTSNIITVCLVYSGPHSVVFPLGPVRTQVSSSQNLVVKVNLSRRCKGGQKAVVKLSSEVSGMCLLAAVRFNMAGSVCSHRWPDCCFFFFFPRQKRFTCAVVSLQPL